MRRTSRISAAAIAAVTLLGAGAIALAVQPSARAGSPAAQPLDGIGAAVATATAGQKYRHGVLPYKDGVSPYTRAQPATERVHYAGGTDAGSLGKVGVQTGGPKVYVVYVGSQWGDEKIDAEGYHVFDYDGGVPKRQQQFYRGIGTNGEAWSGAVGEYCEGVSAGAATCPAGATHVVRPSTSVLGGVWHDKTADMSFPITADRIAATAVEAATHFGNTTPESNRNAQYVLAYPSGSTPDSWNMGTGIGWCAWHSYSGDPNLPGGPAPSSVGNVAFTTMPYFMNSANHCGNNSVRGGVDGNLDGVTLVAGQQFLDMLVNPFPGWPGGTAAGGWQEPVAAGGATAGALEPASTCAWIPVGEPGGAFLLTTATGTFPVQGAWSNAAGSCLSGMGGVAGKPSVLYNPNNRNVEVYVNAGGSLAEKYWMASNGRWSDWNDFGHAKTLSGTPAPFYNPNNRNIEIYTNTENRDIQEKYWTFSTGQWSGWSDLSLQSSQSLDSPVVFYNPNNRNIEVYVASGDRIQENYWNAADGRWSDWHDLGLFGYKVDAVDTPFVLYNPNNRNIEIYANAGGHLVEKYWNASNGQWSGWNDFGGPITGSPTALYNPNNRNIEIYAVSNTHPVERYWNAANGQWSGWNDLGGRLVGETTVLYNPNNRNIEIYGNSGSALVEKYWNAGNGQWSDWNNLGGDLSSDPALFYNPNNRNIEIYAVSAGHLEEKYWNAGNGQWSDWNTMS